MVRSSILYRIWNRCWSRRLYLIADNRLVEFGGCIQTIEIKVDTGTLDGIGYDEEDLQNLLEDVEKLDEEIKDNEKDFL